MIKERAIDAGALSGAAALVLAAWWLAGQMADHPAVPIAEPRPTVTVTARTPASPVSVPPSSNRAEETGVVAVAAPGGTSGSSADRPGVIAPSGPSPAPRPPASGSSTGGVRAAVRLSHPLGVLPGAQLDLIVGGTDDRTG